MKNNMRFFGLFLAALVLLPGCMHVSSYKRRSLQLVRDHCTYRGAEENVIIRAKLLSREDKSALFGSHSALIHDNDLQIIYLSIHNLSNLHYLFSPVDIDLSMMSYRDVAQLMKTSSVSRLATGIAYSASTVVVAYGASAFDMISQLPILFPVLGAVTASMALVFFGASIKSMVMNSRIKKDLVEKVLHGPVVIHSGEQYEGLVFVKLLDYSPMFAVTMHEKSDINNTITFDVDLRQNEQQEEYVTE